MDIKDLEKYGIDTETVRECIDNYKNGDVTVAVTGEFSSGKSCFINAVIKQQALLPVGDKECTPIYIDLSFGDLSKLSVMYKDRYIEHLEFSKEQIEKFARYDPEVNTNALALIAELPEFPLGKGLHIFDCPGTNTIVPEHEKITELIIQRSDVIIYVINKLIKGDELKRISSLYDMNEDMIFVLSHMDENDGSQMRSDETINKYMTEARNVLSKELGINPEKVKLYPVGSVYAFKDSHLIDAVCSKITAEAERIRADVLKEKAKKKLIHYLDNVLAEERAKLTLMERLKADEHSEKKLDLDNAKNHLDKMKSTLLNIVDQDKEFVNKRVDALLKRVEDISKSSSDRIIKSISVADNCSIETVRHEFDKELPTYDTNIKNAIKQTIQVISKEEFKEISDRLNQLGEDYLGVCNNVFEITPPDTDEEITSSYTVDMLKEKEAKLREEVNALSDERKKELESIEDQKDELAEKAKEIENKQEALSELGSYHPEYETVTEEGGKNTGAAIGKAVGLLGDIALLIYAPEAAPMKALDIAKDLSTITGLGLNTAENVINIISGDDDDAKKKKSKHFKDKKKGSNKKKNGKKLNATSSALSKASKAISLISLSNWGEKAGTAIGEYIKPQVSFKKENLEKRAEYYSQKDALDKDIAIMETRLKNKKDELEQLSTSSVTLEKLKEAKRTLEALEQLRKKEEADTTAKLAYEKERLTIEYYCNCVAAEFNSLVDINKKSVSELMERVKQLINDAALESANNRINELQKTLDNLNVEETAAKKELENCRERLEEINNIRNSVDQWLDENYEIS